MNKLPFYLSSPDPLLQVNTWEIYDDLSKLSVSKAGGPDNIPPKLLKEFAYELRGPVTDIINASLNQGKVPLQWKQAYQSSPSIDKLHPISLTSCLAKLLKAGFASGFLFIFNLKLTPDSIW